MKDLKKQYLKTYLIGAVLLTGIALLLNMVFNNLNIGRFDLTADQVYQLSPSVKTILSQLEAPIDITYYVSSSEKMPTQWKNLERDVIDKLSELELASKGMLRYEVFDPSAEEEKEAFEEEKASEDGSKPKVSRKKIAERLAEKGVIPFGVQSAERDEFAIKRVYSSLVLSYLDRKEDVIEEVRPQNFGSMEYEIISRIYKLISNKKPKIAFYPSTPEIPEAQRQYYQQAPPDMYTSAVQMLKDIGYDVTRTNIKENDPIPEDIQTMLIMIDQPLNERQLYEIDKLVHKGVHVIMAAQQHNYQIMASSTPGKFDMRGMSARLNINSLTQTWGFEFDDKMFMDNSMAYIQIPVTQNINMGGFQLRGQRMEPVAKPVIIKVNQENINSKLSISNKITELFYLFGGRMKTRDNVLEENEIASRILFTSSDQSWVKDSNPYGFVDLTPPDPDEVLRNAPFAFILEGKFPAKHTETIPEWPSTPSEDDEDDIEELPSELTGNPEETKIIAIGCSNMFKNDILQPAGSHQSLLRNCVDALTLGDELINIRSKNIVVRRIKSTSPASKAVAKFAVVWFPPIVFVVVGIYINLRRKSKRS